MKTEPATPMPECYEGQEAFERFDALVGAVLAVPHSLIERRQRAYRKKVESNPNRRGPKRKVTPSASSDPVAGS
jgi:hypothetical protein